MTHLLIVILDDLQHLPGLLDAWHTLGVPGVTIMVSAGSYRARTWLDRVGLGALDRLFEAEELRRRTLLAAIDDDALLEQAIAAADRIVGGFEHPDTGLLLVVPVAQAKGMHKLPPKPRPTEQPAPVLRPDWKIRRDTPVEKAAAILNLSATLVRPDTSLDQVAMAMLAQPNVHVACVVDDEGVLMGLINLYTLANALFIHITPEEFLREITQLEDVVRYADTSRMRNAADVMQAPACVKPGETVQDAFKRMHDERLSGLPVVDERLRVIGYVNLLELLAACADLAGSPQAGRGADL